MEVKPLNITVINANGMINMNTPEKVAGKELSWSKGEVLPAIIWGQLAENLFTARVGGKDIFVRCFDFLPLNTKVELELQGQQEDVFLVKPVITNTSEPASQEELMQRVLNQLQVKDTPLHRNLVQGFLNQEIPLRAISLQLAEKMLQKLGRDTPENISKALLGVKLGLPPEPAVLNAVHSFLKDINNFPQGNEAKLHLFINKLVAILGEVRPEEQFRTSGGVAETRPLPAILSTEGYELLQKIQEYLKNISIEPEKGTIKTSEQLKILLSSQLSGLVYKDGLKSTNNAIKLDNSFNNNVINFNSNNINLNSPNLPNINSTSPNPANYNVTTFNENPDIIPNQTAINLSNFDLINQSTPTPNRASPSLPNSPMPSPGTNIISQNNEIIAETGSQVLSISIEENHVTAINEPITREAGQLRQTMGEGTAKQVLQDLTLPADTSKQSLNFTPEIKQKVSDSKFNHRDFGNILQIFSKLIDTLQETAKENGETAQVKSLVQEGTAIERQMAGHQVFQTLNKTDEQQDYLYFNLPFIKQDETQTWGQLKIIKDNSQRKDIDPKHLSMALLLNTISLGPLLLEFKVRNKEIIAGGKVSEEWVANLLRDAWPKLQGSFEKMGYHLHMCAWQVGSFTANLQPTVLKKENTDCSLQTVDIKV